MTSLVVLGGGPALEVRALQLALAEPLAEALEWSWNGLWAHLAAADSPQQQLEALGAQGAIPGKGELLGLPLDPGLLLAAGGHWAEALGAWRQPVLLVLSAGQGQTGLPAAMTALLQHWQVPLVGLIQWGLPWDPDLRRRDGLPWLGVCSPEGVLEAGSLRSAFALALRSHGI